ncbi:hypothetical protein G7Y89_g8255 [Cudoniella acicularis]|uniref:Uncharacterized protein n=1 Tax=Cudoniella acicularis TaxID=354080 RepID=A0A8H4RKK2_9HELO|nr:hypothetical protein G7Y89_g8255 [Cudoniella acicularis]
MSPPSIHLIEDLSDKDTNLLTELLAISPGQPLDAAWLSDQERFIKTNLTPRLLASASITQRIMNTLRLAADRACLCPAHKGLHPQLIRRIFIQICQEVTERQNRLAENRDLPPNVLNLVKRIQTINSFWLSPDMYRQVYQVQPHEKRYDMVANGCEACILAVIGGDRQILFDLWASMEGRVQKRGKKPRLLRMVNSWLAWDSPRVEELKATSAKAHALAEEVLSVRRKMQEERREARARNSRESILSSNRGRRRRGGDSITIQSDSSRRYESPIDSRQSGTSGRHDSPTSNHERWPETRGRRREGESFTQPTFGIPYNQTRQGPVPVSPTSSSNVAPNRNRFDFHESDDENLVRNAEVGDGMSTILGYYTNRLSEANFRRPLNPEDMHPAFGESIAFATTTNPNPNPFDERLPQQPRSQPGSQPRSSGSWVSESVYSVPTNPGGPPDSVLGRAEDERARTYQALVGAFPGERDLTESIIIGTHLDERYRRRSTSPDRQTNSTRWSRFL